MGGDFVVEVEGAQKNHFLRGGIKKIMEGSS